MAGRVPRPHHLEEVLVLVAIDRKCLESDAAGGWTQAAWKRSYSLAACNRRRAGKVMMKKLIVVAAALVALAGYALAAWADDCPPGTTSSCYTTTSGKQVCTCR